MFRRSAAPSRLALAAARKIDAAPDAYTLISGERQTVQGFLADSSVWPRLLGDDAFVAVHVSNDGGGRLRVKADRDGEKRFSGRPRLAPASKRGVVVRLTRADDDMSNTAVNRVLWRAKMLLETGELSISGQG